MKQKFSLIIAALASVATVSADFVDIAIFRVSFPLLSMTPCGLLNNMHSSCEPRKVSDILGVSTLSFQIIAHGKNKDKPLETPVLVIYTTQFHLPYCDLLYCDLSLRRRAFRLVRVVTRPPISE